MEPQFEALRVALVEATRVSWLLLPESIMSHSPRLVESQGRRVLVVSPVVSVMRMFWTRASLAFVVTI